MMRSALFHHHMHAGAKFIHLHGWEMPATFVTPDVEAQHVGSFVGLADTSYRTKFETPIEPVGYGWRLAEGRYLMIADPPVEKPVEAVEVTSVYTNLLLAGPRSRQVLGKLTSLNVSDTGFPNLSCRQSGVGHVHTIVLREDLAHVPAFHLLITRDYAESFWEAVAHAGHEFDLWPFGLEALERLRV